MAFKMRSGNTPSFKNMGSSPLHKDDEKVKKYSDLPEDQRAAAREYNMSTYGTHNPTSYADKLGVSKGDLAKFHAKSKKLKDMYDEHGVDATENVITEEEFKSGNVAEEKKNTKKQTQKHSPRFHGLSEQRVKDIKQKELNRKERKAKYKKGTSDIKKGGIELQHDQAFYEKQRNNTRYMGMSNERIQELLDKKAKRKKRSSKYKRGTSEEK